MQASPAIDLDPQPEVGQHACEPLDTCESPDIDAGADVTDGQEPAPILVRSDPLVLALRGPAVPLPDFAGCPSLWICLRGMLVVQGRDGPFLLTGRQQLTLPGDQRPLLLPGSDGLGLLVAIPPSLFGRAVFAMQPRNGLQRMPFALRSSASPTLLKSTFDCLRNHMHWDPTWLAFQCVQMMHEAQTAQSEIACWMARAPGRTDMHRRVALHRLLHARNRILNCPFEEHDIDSLSAAARYSKSHFIKAFRDVFAETPGALHARARIAMAKQLIAQGALSIGEIAMDLGYGSRCAFSRSFKTHVGMNASVFRKQRDRSPRRSMAGA